MPREHWELAGPAMTPQYVKEHADELGGMGTHLCAHKKNYGKALVIRSLKNNTRRKEINPLGALSRKDRYQAQRILETAAA